MPKIEVIVTNLPWQPHHRERFLQALPGAKIVYLTPGDFQALTAKLRDADTAVIMGKLDLKNAARLRWLHWDAAGLDSIAKPEYFKSSFVITGSAGRSAPALAEHAFFFMLNHAYHHDLVFGAQAHHQWGYPGQESMEALYGKTLGIIGMGNTGRALAKRAKAFEMRVIAYSRRRYDLADVDKFYSQEAGGNLDVFLPQCDYLAMCAALTDQTYHMLGSRELALMKKTAVVINLGRGKTIDEAALVKALQDGQIAGAGLDTFEIEPLPKDSPVWDAPHMMVTPHFTPACPDKLGRSLDIILENARRFEAGEPLLNQLKEEDLYTK